MAFEYERPTGTILIFNAQLFLTIAPNPILAAQTLYEIAITIHQQVGPRPGLRLSEAEESYRRGLRGLRSVAALDSGALVRAVTEEGLASICHQTGRLKEAEALLRSTLSLSPRSSSLRESS